MDYVVHKRFKHKGISGKDFNLPWGTHVDLNDKNILTYENSAICYNTSQSAHKHFSRNDDGNGLERGKLTYEIAYADRRPNKNDGFRFTEEERDMLQEHYSHFLQNNGEWILFNHHFFNADIDELRELAQKLEVH